jgi:hypothetical protein
MHSTHHLYLKKSFEGISIFILIKYKLYLRIYVQIRFEVWVLKSLRSSIEIYSVGFGYYIGFLYKYSYFGLRF